MDNKKSQSMRWVLLVENLMFLVITMMTKQRRLIL